MFNICKHLRAKWVYITDCKSNWLTRTILVFNKCGKCAFSFFHKYLNMRNMRNSIPTLLFIVYLQHNLYFFPWRCFIPNVYAALCTAALVPLICIVGVLVIFIHAYQVTQQWKAYDDIYRGRTNSSGVCVIAFQVTCFFKMQSMLQENCAFRVNNW